jgi:hypothetical protein
VLDWTHEKHSAIHSVFVWVNKRKDSSDSAVLNALLFQAEYDKPFWNVGTKVDVWLDAKQPTGKQKNSRISSIINETKASLCLVFIPSPVT